VDAAQLRGRRRECAALDQLVSGVRAGESRLLVLRGEPGVGKTALLDYLAGQAVGCRVARASGVQSEMELAFAGMHQLCGPMLDQLDGLPVPQQEALRTAFGLSAGPAPDRFLAPAQGLRQARHQLPPGARPVRRRAARSRSAATMTRRRGRGTSAPGARPWPGRGAPPAKRGFGAPAGRARAPSRCGPVGAREGATQRIGDEPESNPNPTCK